MYFKMSSAEIFNKYDPRHGEDNSPWIMRLNKPSSASDMASEPTFYDQSSYQRRVRKSFCYTVANDSVRE